MIDGGLEQLKDLNVRKALSLAIDREYINKTVFADSRIPAYCARSVRCAGCNRWVPTSARPLA